MYKKLLFGVALFGLFSVLFAACAIVDTANLNANIPAVHMGSASFLQSSVTIKKGDMLNLIDDSSSPHNITNGSWVGSTQKPAKEAGAPSITQNYSGSDSAPVGPFTNTGTFHIYCTIHPGMNLTIVVK